MTDVPRTLGLLWGRDEAGRRGPKRTLTVAQVGEAAIRVADVEGLAAVTMKRVADELGVTAMALYRYVESRADLELVMLEYASADVPDPTTTDWREGLRQWCHAYRRLLLDHPWALEIPLSGPPLTPYQLRWMEAALRVLATTGLSVTEQVMVLLQVNVYVRGDAALNVQVGRGDEDVSARWSELVRELAGPDDYPAVHALLETPEMEQDDDPLEQFAFGLETTLDGIERLVHGRA